MGIVDIQGRATKSSAEFQQAKRSDRSLALIEEGTIVERFSIELTVGSAWSRRYGPQSKEMVEIGEDGVRLAANESVVIEVAERIGVPLNMYGLVIPTGSLFLDRGIIIAAAKIEPAFNDKLKLRLVNASGQQRIIKQGEKVASAIFFGTELTEDRPEFQKRVLPVKHLPGRPHRLWEWIKANRIPVITWIVTLAGSSVMAWALGRASLASPNPTPPNPARSILAPTPAPAPASTKAQ